MLKAIARIAHAYIPHTIEYFSLMEQDPWEKLHHDLAEKMQTAKDWDDRAAIFEWYADEAVRLIEQNKAHIRMAFRNKAISEDMSLKFFDGWLH